MSEVFNLFMIGLGNGAIYSMIALGLVVIYRSTGLLNFAQGEMAMFTTFLVWTLSELGWPLPLALLGGMVLGFLVGALVHQVIVRPVGDPHEKPLAVVIVTIGLYLGIHALAKLIWGTTDQDLDKLFGGGQVDLFGTKVAWQKLGAVFVLGIEALVFYFIFQKTKIGLAMRAVASNPESAGLVGVPVTKVLMIGWGLAAALGAVAGTFLAPSSAVSPNLMQLALIYGFAAITLGGFDSFVGAVVGGLTIGVLTDVLPYFDDNLGDFASQMPLAPAFILILIVLLIRPQGLFGTKRVERV